MRHHPQFGAPYSSSEFKPSQMMKKQQQNRQQNNHQKQFPPLPESIVAHLRTAFKQLDRKSTGLVPYEYINSIWPLNFSVSSPLPPNFLATLRRISPPDRLINFQLFLHAAQLAMLERFAMSSGNFLKRTKSEAKLLREGKIEMEENINLIAERIEIEERERSKSRTSTPAMGLAGRKLDNRENSARLAKMKKASRSQPQLNELFEEEPEQKQRGLRRTEQFIDEDAVFNMKFVEENDRNLRGQQNGNVIMERQKKPKSMKAPAPPIPTAISTPTIQSPPSPPIILPNCGNNGLGNGSANYAALKRSKEGGGAIKAAVNKNNINNDDGQSHNPPPASAQRQRRPVSVAGLAPIAPMHRANSSIGMPISPTICHEPQQNDHFHQTNGSDGFPQNNYAHELQPQVAKHERLLGEEFQIVHSGQSMAHQLLDWYNGRVESLEKRRRMLQKGMVALDSAVHEQKLNFHRAQIAELNRRIKAFLGASEGGGFPGHGNTNSNQTQQPIRNQVLPPLFPPHSPHHCAPILPPSTFNSCSVASSSSNASSSTNSSSASCSLPLDGTFSSASEAEFLRAQNQKLMRDIRVLTHQMEKIQNQNHQNSIGNGFSQAKNNNNGWSKDYNMIWRGLANTNGYGQNLPPSAKDTLL